MTRVYLSLVGLIFLGYGVACAIDPTLAARLAGLSILNADGFAELGAMYGGLQSGVGLFLLYAAFRPSLHEASLMLLLLGIGSLAIMRGISVLRVDEIASAYTWGALTFESLVTAIAAALITRKG